MATWNEYYNWLGDACLSKSQPLAEVLPDKFVTDTRAITKGDFFVPLVGETFNGHDFIDSAVESGAAGFFYEGRYSDKISEASLPFGIEVTDTLVAFQKIAQGYRKTLTNLTLIAITGSNGKTTVKEILNHILQTAGPAYATFGSFNNEIGVPKSLLQIKPEHKFAALEFGARKECDIEFLVQMANPNIGSVLNAGGAHIETFGDEKTLLKTKTEMATSSSLDMTFIYPKEDRRIDKIAQTFKRSNLSFGINDGDITVINSSFIENGKMTLSFRTPQGDLSVVMGCCHETLPINCAAAVAMALAAGIKPDIIKKGLELFQGVSGRFQVMRLKNLTLVDDAYNANPQSMRAGLGSLKKSFAKDRFTLILGDMLEVGPQTKQEHFAM